MAKYHHAKAPVAALLPYSSPFALQIVEAVYEPVPEGIYSEKVITTISR